MLLFHETGKGLAMFMNARKRVIIGAACALCAAVFVLIYAAQVRAQEREVREEALARYGGEQIEVCVATRNIAIGEEFNGNNTTTALWVADLLPEECITSLSEIHGAAAGSTVLANEPISRQRISSQQQDIEVPTGLCAVSIPSQDVRAVGGAVTKGSLANIYASTDSGTVLLGESLLVLETNNSSQEATMSNSALSWVTLAVTPESVQELLNASRSGNLYLTLPSTAQGDEKNAG